MPAVVVELLRLSAGLGGLGVTRTQAPLRGAPDELARALAGVQGGAPAGVVLHSTSWRYERGRLLLTYALFPAAADPLTEPLEHLHVVTGPDPLRPGPRAVDVRAVAAHAVRHLADLAERDPHVKRCAQSAPGAWQVLCDVGAQVHTGVSPPPQRAFPLPRPA